MSTICRQNHRTSPTHRINKIGNGLHGDVIPLRRSVASNACRFCGCTRWLRNTHWSVLPFTDGVSNSDGFGTIAVSQACVTVLRTWPTYCHHALIPLSRRRFHIAWPEIRRRCAPIVTEAVFSAVIVRFRRCWMRMWMSLTAVVTRLMCALRCYRTFPEM